MSPAPHIDWSRAQLTESGSTLQVPVTGATPEWCSQFKYVADLSRHTAFQHPWGHIGLIGDVIFVPAIAAGAEQQLRETIEEMVARAQRRVAAAPRPDSPAEMLQFLRTFAG